MFKNLTEDILKLDIPFDDVGTSIFLINTQDGYLIIDCGTYQSDITNHLLPAIEKLKIPLDEIKGIFLTHAHGDHAGGLPHLLAAIPSIEVLSFNPDLCNNYSRSRLLTDGERLYGVLKALSLKGHSYDSGGIFDSRSASLITGDALQLWGIGKYGCGIGLPEDYIKTISLIKKLSPQNIFTSHGFYPLGSTALGSDKVLEYLSECESFFISITEFVKSEFIKGNKNAELITERFMTKTKASHPNSPILPVWTVSEIFKTLD